MLNVNEYFSGKVKSIGFDSDSIGRASQRGRNGSGRVHLWYWAAGRDDSCERRVDGKTAGQR